MFKCHCFSKDCFIKLMPHISYKDVLFMRHTVQTTVKLLWHHQLNEEKCQLWIEKWCSRKKSGAKRALSFSLYWLGKPCLKIAGWGKTQKLVTNSCFDDVLQNAGQCNCPKASLGGLIYELLYVYSNCVQSSRWIFSFVNLTLNIFWNPCNIYSYVNSILQFKN